MEGNLDRVRIYEHFNEKINERVCGGAYEERALGSPAKHALVDTREARALVVRAKHAVWLARVKRVRLVRVRSTRWLARAKRVRWGRVQSTRWARAKRVRLLASTSTP